ncbi:MAG: TonB-dependent receptor [Gemmatimonadaceae bacterium]
MSQGYDVRQTPDDREKPRVSNVIVRLAAPAVLASAMVVQVLTAQTPKTADSTRAGRLDTMRVTAAHYDNGVGTSNAASAGHVGPQMIDDRPLLRPGEVMEYIPGMIITQHSGGGKANQYFLRGFNLDHGTDFATSLGGMPVNMPTHAHGQGYTDLNFMIPELVSGIDYYKGPYYAAQSDFATSGSANILYADGVRATRPEFSGGSNGYARALSVGAGNVRDGRLVYGIEADRIDGPWVHPDNYRKGIAVVRYSQPIDGGSWSLMAMGYDGKWNGTDQIPERAYDAGTLSRFGTIDTTDGGLSHRYSLSGDLQKSLGGGTLKSTAYAINYSLDLFSNFTFFLNDPVHGDQIEQRDDRNVFGWNGSWTAPSSKFGLFSTNTIGWDTRFDRVSPSGLYHTADRARIGTTIEDRVDENRAALFFENQTQLAPWLRSIAGLRVERYDFSVASNTIANSGNGSTMLGLPKLTLVAGPWSETEFFANVGEGFHSNDVRGATERVDPSTGESVSPVTPLVRGVGAEVGVRSDRISNLQTSLSLWSLHLGSELVFSGDEGTTEAGRPSERVGVEWASQYTPNRWVLLDLDLATTRARYTDNDPVGKFIPEALQATTAAGVTVRNIGPWMASIFYRYFGPRSLTESDSIQSPPTTLWNSQATYQLTKRFSLRADVFNMLDTKAPDITYYYTSRLAGEPAAGVDDFHFHPVERRSIRIGLLGAF